MNFLKYLIDVTRTPWSIMSVATRATNDWLKFNKKIRDRCYSPIERELLFGFQEPIRFGTWLIVFNFISIFVVSTWPYNHFTPAWFTWTAAEQLSHFSTVWTIQVTMVALVYPIVISFIAVYLQRRPASNIYIQLYMLHTGSVPAGISSLLLVGVMGVQYLLMSMLGADSLPIWTTVNTAWLVINTLLTTFFLFRTVEFLRPETQQEVVERYCVNVALPIEVQRLHSYHLLADIGTSGWISIPPETRNRKNQNPKVYVSTFFSRGESGVSLKLTRRSRLKDVRLWPLKIAIDSWYRQAKAISDTKSSKDNRVFETSASLSIPFCIGEIYDKEIPLAYVSNGPKLKTIYSILLRQSVSISSHSLKNSTIKIADVLEEMAGEVRSAASKAVSEVFDQSYWSLLDIHKLLLEASLYKNKDGEISSWALLPDPDSRFYQPLHINWCGHYRGITEAAIEAMTKNNQPVQRLCHLPQHLEEVLRICPTDIRQSSLLLLPRMQFQLSLWWSARAQEQGFSEHNHDNSTNLRAPLKLVYEKVQSEFIGGWENSRPYLQDTEEQKPNWTEFSELAKLNRTHINESGKMLLDAVRRGDTTAAEWLADALNKWSDSWLMREEAYQLYSVDKFISVEDLDCDWKTFTSKFNIDEDENLNSQYYLPIVQFGVYVSSLKNYLIDIKLTTIELLLEWYFSSDENLYERSLAFQIAHGLLSGKQWREGGSVLDPHISSNLSDYLIAKVRQLTSTGPQKSSYARHFDGFIASVSRKNEPEFISSRIYTSSGRDDFFSVGKSQVALFIILTSRELNLPSELSDQLNLWFSNHADQFDKVGKLQNILKFWLDLIPEVEQKHIRHIQHAKSKIDQTTLAADAVRFLTAGLEKLTETIGHQRQEVINTYQIDTTQLQEISTYVSQQVFEKATAKFPINMFDLTTSEDQLKPFTLRIKQLRRGLFTVPPTEQRPVNEKKHYAEMMSKCVSNAVLADILREPIFKEINVFNAQSYWEALKSEARLIRQDGGNPILVIGNPTEPKWLWDWQNAPFSEKHIKPDDLQIHRHEKQPDGYLFHFNDIAVFQAPIERKTSLIISSKIFKSLRFTKLLDNNFVTADVKESEPINGLIDLEITFYRATEIGSFNCVKLVCE